MHGGQQQLDQAQQTGSDGLSAAATGGGGWSLSLLCMGLGLVAFCLVVPAIEQNRQRLYDLKKLKLDLEQLQRQVAANDQFVKRVADDPSLAERLAQRQMRLIRQGTQTLELKDEANRADMSPLALVAVPPPPPLEQYRPTGGKLAAICRNRHTQLYLLAAGMLLVAMGLVLGYAQRQEA